VDNIKIELNDIGCGVVDWISLVQTLGPFVG
jgi:hypothetical protein